MSDVDIRADAEAHWEYTEGIIRRTIKVASQNYRPQSTTDKFIELCKYLYVEAMIHGYGHGKEESEK